MKVMAVATAAMILATPAVAQLYSKQAAPRSLAALRAAPKPNFTLPPKLTAVQRNVAVKALTGNPAATASAEPIEFSANLQSSTTSLEFRKVESFTLGGMLVLLQSGGSVTLGLPGYGASAPSGTWLFDCGVTGDSVTWSGAVKGSYGKNRIGGSVPVSNVHAVFAVDMNQLDGGYVQIESGSASTWYFGYCSATPVK
jgi:hypothetical protein